MSKVLLLNPPGDKVYLRDSYCSKVSKSGYITPPVDLIILSGLLASRFEVEVLDAIAERLSYEESYQKIMNLKIEAIIFLTGEVSWERDFEFLHWVKSKRENLLMVGSGDVLMEEGVEIINKNSFLDAILLDYTESSILDYLEGRRSNLENLIFRDGERVIISSKVEQKSEFSIPLPQHKLFPFHKYSWPFARRTPFTGVVTDFGCPYKCDFCLIGQLGFKTRPPAEVLKELLYIQSLGIKEIFFGDQTFGVKRERAINICEGMLRERINLSWGCFSRVDLVDHELLDCMRIAGCHTIIFGVESGNDEILKRYHKGFTIAKVRETFRLCQEMKITTVATFILGLPGENEASCYKTIALAKEIGCDYASFNIPVPRKRTPLREEALKHGWILPEVREPDQSGTVVGIQTAQLSANKLQNLRRQAEKEFYLRPSCLLRLLVRIRTFTELKNHLKQGRGLFRK
ncbi:MAG: radical SAM protein [Candidatus Edwardsbacteria bacterium]